MVEHACSLSNEKGWVGFSPEIRESLSCIVRPPSFNKQNKKHKQEGKRKPKCIHQVIECFTHQIQCISIHYVSCIFNLSTHVWNTFLTQHSSHFIQVLKSGFSVIEEFEFIGRQKKTLMENNWVISLYLPQYLQGSRQLWRQGTSRMSAADQCSSWRGQRKGMSYRV